MSPSRSDSTVYVYCAGEMGIPGLPHRLTRAEARELGLEKLLDEAVAAGAYQAEFELDRQPVIHTKESDDAD